MSKKISELVANNPAAAFNGTEQIECVQSATSKGGLISQIATWFRGIINQFTVQQRFGKSPVTADALADIITTAALATRKPLVVQGAASQSANLTEWQKSDGTTVGTLDPSGNVVFAGTVAALVGNGTPPFTISSSTNVANLNASSLNGATFSAPGPIGSVTASTGAFTTLAASSTVSGAGFSTYLASPPAIGGTAPAAGSFTTVILSSTGTIVWNSDSTLSRRGSAGVVGVSRGTSPAAIHIYNTTDVDVGSPTNYERLQLKWNGASQAEVSVGAGGTGNSRNLTIGVDSTSSGFVQLMVGGNGAWRVVTNGHLQAVTGDNSQDIGDAAGTVRPRSLYLGTKLSLSSGVESKQNAGGTAWRITDNANNRGYNLGGCIFDHFADAATTHTDGTEDDLYSDTVAASQLAANGDKIKAHYTLKYVGHAVSTDRTQGYFAGTKVIDSGAINFATAGNADVFIEIIRESATVVRVTAEYVPSGITLQPIVTYTRITGLTLTGTNILKITGINTGTNSAAGDITAVYGTVDYCTTATA